MEDRPDLYDWTYQGYNEDLGYWRSVVGTGPVLELGAGSGRISVPLSAAGVDVIALDHSADMLHALGKRSVAEGVVVRRLCARMQYLPLRTASLTSVICPFGSVNYLLDQEDWLRLFAEVRRVLRPGGVFAFEALAWATFGDWLHGAEERVVKQDRTNERVVTLTCRYAFDSATQLARQVRTYTVKDRAGEVEHQVLWVNRYAMAGEIRAMLRYAGLMIADEAGDYNGGRYRHDSEFYLVRCRADR
ncbi:class I SAM-dependent methyltransferase [Streptomyces sp. R39]|uniref:Class I SAM-dependent methyltransferase n=1 Tax=Streptomyces sp. R39 TaxID=3238631 RepID=A0AB39QSU8_9ACTN